MFGGMCAVPVTDYRKIMEVVERAQKMLISMLPALECIGYEES